MRVLHAFKLYRPAEGGVISVMRDLIESAPEGVQSDVVACRDSGPAKMTVGRATVYRSRSLFELMSLPVAPAYPFSLLHRAQQCDVVACHSPFPLGELPCALFSKRLPPYVVHWHSEVIAQKRTAQLLGPLTRRYLDRAAAILVSTPGHVDVSPWLKRYRDKCHVIPFGVRAPANSELQRPRALPPGWPETFGVFVGRLVPYKGLSTLLQAAKAANAPLVIAGSGPLEDALRDEVRRLGLSDSVCLLGEVSEAEKGWLLERARCLVLPSTGANETFGVVQLEAMIRGLPVINTDAHPGIGWVARNRKEGLTVRHGDARELAEALRSLLADSAFAAALGEAARQRAQSEFGYERFVDGVHEVYRSVSGQ